MRWVIELNTYIMREIAGLYRIRIEAAAIRSGQVGPAGTVRPGRPRRVICHSCRVHTVSDEPEELLSRHRFVHTDDPEYARREVSKIFAPHSLSVLGDRRDFAVRHNHVRLRTLSLNYFHYRTGVRIASGPTTSYYIVLMPLAGRCVIRYGDDEVTIAPGTLGVVNRLEPIRLDWLDGCAQLALKLDNPAVERHLADHLRRPALAGPLTFAFDPPPSTERAATLVDMLRLIVRDLDGVATLTSGAAETAAEELLLSLALAELPHDQAGAMTRPVSRAAPYYVKRVEEFIHTHAGEAITLGDMVAVAGVGARTLFKGFREFRDTGPKAYLKSVRLDRVRADLAQAAIKGRTVTDVATRWGFTHLGNFARDYRLRFGEPPSATLRRVRG